MATQTNSAVQSEAVRRKAVAERDSRFDNQFVFGVRSTGIYCQPSCPARRPRPEQMVFFDAPEAAERSGYRPCRRCSPRGDSPNPQAKQLARLCGEMDRILAAEPDRRLTLARLAQTAGMSLHQLARIFRRLLGVTPRQYVDTQRLREVKALLRRGANVTDALYGAGYGSSSRLYERAPSQLGMTPAAYRRGGERIQMRYTVVSCPLGRLLVAATERGISAVYLGDSDARLAAELAREFPRASIQRDRESLERWVGAIVEHLRGRQPLADLPVDVQATAFQRRVWEELRRIPYGATRSYSEIARAIGRPGAVRAVARACATNPASIVIPCHRVVREDGSLAGYRWGLDRKRALIAKEKAVAGTCR
ncbi:MAG TPA: bifunctional DNA-binding transcriptional regulator/O6-methylguanine-DNA methyltransferase Ada [Candidatus Acidoferrales bacterium]|nr:bifunctional DNA-binding transcriptional regulator/O6-methylguanine-DNA methyltransferase Ada [Candidatus Acidoferrales bacterium]